MSHEQSDDTTSAPKSSQPALSTPRKTAGSVAILMMLLAGCGVSEEASSRGATSEPVEGGTIVYGHDQEPPCLWGGWVQQAYISRQILDSLTSTTEDGEIVPWLAEDWEVSDDQLTWTFHLKEDVKFTDGTDLDAEAVSRNFEYWINEGGNSSVELYLGTYYDTSRAVDKYTFELELLEPYSPLLSALSQGYFGIQSPEALERGDEANCEEPIGSGPFYVENWTRGSHVDLKRNDDYSSAPDNALHDGPAYVEGVTWRFVDDPIARYGSLTTGETDVIYDIPTPQWDAAKEQFQVDQYITPGRPMAIGLNTVEGVFEDKKVRQAFAFGTDRKTAVETAFNGVIPYEGSGVLSQTTPSYNEDTASDYDYDPERANELLDEAGWTERDPDGYRTKDGEQLRVRFPYGAGSYITTEGEAALQSIQHDAKEVGINLKLLPVSRDELASGNYSNPGSYDAKAGYWTSPTSGVLLINFRQHLPPESPNNANSSFYNNPELEQVIRDANSTLDREEQDEFYGEAQQILSDEAVSVGLYTQTFSIAVDHDLQDVWLEDSQGEPVFHDAYFVQ